MKFLLSTIADISYEDESKWPGGMRNSLRSAEHAAQYGLGLEIAEFCISGILDDGFEKTEQMIRKKMELAPALVLHAPYNELFPCAIEPKAAELAVLRYEQAIRAALDYGVHKVVIHSGFAPSIYYESWFVQRSIRFWKEFLAMHPGDYVICLENVMEEKPDMLCHVAEGVDDARFGLCLDVGHAYRCSRRQPLEWLDAFRPWIRHLHIHNNTGGWDTHNAVDDGDILMCPLLERGLEICPKATCTVESMNLERSVKWLHNNGFLEVI